MSLETVPTSDIRMDHMEKQFAYRLISQVYTLGIRR